MNNNRRKQIQEAVQELEHIKSVFENIRDEEQEYFDNMPENMQGGDKGQSSESAISSLDDVINSIEESITSAEESAGN